MPVSSRDLIAFFEAYARRSADALRDPPMEDVEGVVASFAPWFVESSPRGVVGGENGDDFRNMVPQGFAGWRKAGGKDMRAERIEVTELDDLHAMVAVDWVFDYVRPSDGKAGSVPFTNRYFVTLAEGSPRIFAYISPDEQAAMQAHGLV